MVSGLVDLGDSAIDPRQATLKVRRATGCQIPPNADELVCS
jgi:hypothetical protein